MQTFFRLLFSWQAGLLWLVILMVWLAWFLVLRPTVYQNWQVEQAVKQLEAAGCKHTVLETTIFDDTPILKHWNPDVKILGFVSVSSGKTIPDSVRKSGVLSTVFSFDFDHAAPTDADYAWAANLPSIQYLSIRGKHGVTDKGFAAIPPGKDYGLTLSEVPDLETNLRNLASAPCPASLMIFKCQLNDETFSLLGHMTELRQLSLMESDGVTVEGLRQLQNLTLQSLVFRHVGKPEAKFSEEMIAEIAKMRSLEYLSLIHAEPLSEKSIEALRSLPQLQTIWGVSEEDRDKILIPVRTR